MITIEQLLESVDLDFEPRFVTKDEDGVVEIWNKRPDLKDEFWGACDETMCCAAYDQLKLSEFAGKPWQKCIYEVPRKTTGNEIEQKMLAELERKLNAIVDTAIKAVNELKGANNE